MAAMRAASWDFDGRAMGGPSPASPASPRRGRGPMVGGEMDGPFYMDAGITPQRSLSRKGFIVLISVLTGINTLTAIVFLAMRAAPVPLFLGLDVIAVAVAFVASARSARRRERIQVTADEVRVVLETPRGEHT